MITSNAAQIVRNIDKFIDVHAKDIDEALLECGERGTSLIKKGSPVVSGRLRNSMGYTFDHKVKLCENDKLNPSSEKGTVIIGTNVIYAPSVEYTSSTSKGFMLRAYNQLKPIAEKIFKDALGRRL